MQYKIRLRPENSGSPAFAERACPHVACAVRLFDPVVVDVEAEIADTASEGARKDDSGDSIVFMIGLMIGLMILLIISGSGRGRMMIG